MRKTNLHLQWHLHLGLLLDILYIKTKAVNITETLRYSILLSILAIKKEGYREIFAPGINLCCDESHLTKDSKCMINMGRGRT